MPTKGGAQLATGTSFVGGGGLDASLPSLSRLRRRCTRCTLPPPPQPPTQRLERSPLAPLKNPSTESRRLQLSGSYILRTLVAG